jgi:hypothetical protein
MARRAFGGLRPLAKCISAPPVRKSDDYRGLKRREAAKLKQYLDKRYEGGIEGETVVHLLNCFFNEFPDVLESVCIERGLHTAVEQRVVDAVHEHWTIARASFVRVTCKITWRRYQDLIHALGKRWNEETGEHEIVLLPHGMRVPYCRAKMTFGSGSLESHSCRGCKCQTTATWPMSTSFRHFEESKQAG